MSETDLFELVIKALGFNLAINLICRALDDRVEHWAIKAAGTPSPVDDIAVSRLQRFLRVALMVTGTLRSLSELGVFRRPKR